MPVLDGAASIGIGLVLIGTAAVLMIETHGLLIGEAADQALVARIGAMARAEPDVRHVNEILTQHLGPDDILINVSLDIRDDISGREIEALVSRLESRLEADSDGVRRIFIEMQSRGA